jgi:hypothetical protein
MNILPVFFLWCLTTQLHAGELDNADLLHPKSYTLKHSGTNTNLTRIGVVFKSDDSLKKKVLESIKPYKAQLLGYFANQNAMDTFINNTVDQAAKTHLDHNYNDNVRRFLKAIGNNLVAGIAQKILEGEGVKDPARRQLWIDKILTPYNNCANDTWNALESQICLEALTGGLVANTGVAIAYELSRENLGSKLPLADQQKFNDEQANSYEQCMWRAKVDASKVKDCVLETMRGGIIKVSDVSLTKTLNEKASSPEKAKDIKKLITPAFKLCVDKVGTDPKNKASLPDQFNICANTLTIEAGAAVVIDSISANPLMNNVMTKEKIAELALKKSIEFKECLNNDASDAKLQECGDLLTKQTTAEVAAESFTNEVQSYLLQARKEDLANQVKPMAVVQEDLDKFLKDLNTSNTKCLTEKAENVEEHTNSCIKASVKKVAFFLADKRFKHTLGSRFDKSLDRLKELEDGFHTALDQCLDSKKGKEFTVTDYTANLYICSESVSRSTALTVGKDITGQSINEFLKDTPLKKLKPLRDEIYLDLTSELASCLDTLVDTSTCTDTLLKTATQKIVVNFGKSEIVAELSTEKMPKSLVEVEKKFIACTEVNLKGDPLAAHLDECTKNYALSFAKELGTLKLNHLLATALGSDEYKKQKKTIDGFVSKYHACLKGLEKYSVEDGVTAMITVCTNELTDKALSLVVNNVNNWMSTDKKDAATLTIKKEFANFLPCLSVLLPSSPYDEAAKLTSDSMLKPIAAVLASYIEYDPKKAKKTLNTIINQLSSDLSSTADTKKAKVELVEYLYSSGALDQLIRSVVQQTVRDSLETLTEDELPAKWRDLLLQKQNFEDIFNTPEGKNITKYVMEKVLRPILVNDVDMNSENIKANIQIVKDKVVNVMVNSSSFGEKIIQVDLQKRIDSYGGFKKFAAKVLYGKKALDWSMVRTTPAGKNAEDFIKKNILAPRFRSEIQTPGQVAELNKQAEILVTNAIKAYN